MYLLVGLGNPGLDYAGNRHNIGFMVVDSIHYHYSFKQFRSKFHGEIADGTISGNKVFILKPMTFMNDSGRSVAEVARFYKIKPNNIFVFHDELDLAPGKVKVKKGGGTAGHNGLKSILSYIGSNFQRVRVGIGHPGEKNLVSGYVLKDFSNFDKEWVGSLLDAISLNVNELIQGDDTGFLEGL
jgi:PTH1 family peptidyl-tRNA hydrolase